MNPLTCLAFVVGSEKYKAVEEGVRSWCSEQEMVLYAACSN